MHFTISKSAFLNALSQVIGATEKKVTIPVLTNLLLTVSRGDVTIQATDLDLSITARAQANVEADGKLCLPAKRLFDLVRSLPESEIEVKEGKTENVTIKCNRSRFTMQGVPAENFPQLSAFEGTYFRLPAAMLQAFINSTIFGLTADESRFTLSGAKLEIKEQSCRMVTTNGHRLCLIEGQLPAIAETALDALIPKKALQELKRITANAEGEIEVGQDQNSLFFQFGNCALSTRKLTGTFPNYEMLLLQEKNVNFRVTFAREEMLAAVARAGLMSSDNNRSIKFQFGSRLAEVESVDQINQGNTAFEAVPAEYDGAPLSVNFNPRYVLDFLAATDAESVSMAMKDATSQAQFQPIGGSFDYRYVVMPMRT